MNLFFYKVKESTLANVTNMSNKYIIQNFILKTLLKKISLSVYKIDL